ncbi:MAG: glycosyltransferase family 39 protein [Kofleriaceae bacterium]
MPRPHPLARLAPWAIAAALVVAVALGRAAWSPPPLARLATTASVAGDPVGTRAWRGSLALPRGGPYIVGFASTGPARLELAGQPPLTGAGVVTARVVLPAGAIGLRFAAPPGARLVWHPPGRRGDPEYVPASSLSSASPGAARFTAPGTNRVDAAAAWSYLLIVGGLALWLGRRRLAQVPRDVALVGFAVFAVAAAARLYDLGAAGQTWDEDTYWSAGRNYLQNLVRGDLDALAWRWNYEHPPVTKYLAGLGGSWSDGFDGARAMSALVLALGCALLVPIGRRLTGDLRVGALAGVIAALSPHLIAHGQIVGHEAPSVAAWLAMLWASLRVWDRGASTRAVAPRLVTVGVLLGVALMTRFVNGLAAPAIGVTIVATAPVGARRRAIGLGLAIIPAVAVVTSIALWPRLWTHPIAHTQEAWAKLKGLHSEEPFLGAITRTPPRWYFLAYLGATSPVVVLVAALGGVVVWAARARRTLLVVAAWLIAPLGVMLSPVRQDGVRYVLPVLALLALPAAAGVVAISRRLLAPTAGLGARPAAGRGARARAALGLTVPVGLVIYLVVTCARIHPYYLDYYGEQVGGTAAVARARQFEVAWWGEGVAAAVDYVNHHAAIGDKVHRDCVEPAHLTWFRGDLWETVRDPRQATWILHYQPSWRPCAIPPDAVRVYRVEAGGAPLCDVYRRRP